MTSRPSFIKIDFTIHVTANDMEVCPSEVNALIQRIALPLTHCYTRSVVIEDRVKYRMIRNSDSIMFVDPENNGEMELSRYLRGLSSNGRTYVYGIIEVARSDLLTLIDAICCNFPNNVISWSCRPNSSNIFDISPGDFSDAFVVNSFRFGNIVNGNRFVCHLNDFQTADGTRFGLMSDISFRISHRCQELVLKFKVSYYFGPIYELKHLRCKFIFAFQSIKEIVTCANYASEFYLKLEYPPKFLIKEGNNWNRWTNCDLISREIIGKCKVLRLRLELDEDGNEIDLSIPRLYSIFRTRDFEIVCTAMENYCIDYSMNINDFNFPFEVKYILQCIDSISYAFGDDLIINNKTQQFFSIIETLVSEGRTDYAVEALTRLFNAYFYANPEVFDALESLQEIITAMGDVIVCSQKNHDKNDCLKRIVLTPMRVLYLPPSSSESKFISTSPNISRLIKVHIRDEDHSRACTSPYPYLSEDFGECDFSYQVKDVKCKTFFLKQIIGKKLFGENGLLKNNSYRYLGSSLTELFIDGIVVEAENSS